MRLPGAILATAAMACAMARSPNSSPSRITTASKVGKLERAWSFSCTKYQYVSVGYWVRESNSNMALALYEHTIRATSDVVQHEFRSCITHQVDRAIYVEYHLQSARVFCRLHFSGTWTHAPLPAVNSGCRLHSEVMLYNSRHIPALVEEFCAVPGTVLQRSTL